jgi:hypothetical protein
MRVPFLSSLISIVLLFSLAGCDRLGIPDPAKEAAAHDEEGKAIGGACRQSGRALEDCFTLNPNANKASVFNGWKDMNDYMTQNKIDTVKPEFPVPGMLVAKRAKPSDDSASSSDAGDDQASAPADDQSDRRSSRAARKRRATADKDADGAPAKAG